MCAGTRHHCRVMKTARWVSLLAALVLLAAACDDGGDVGAGDGEPSRGVKRGTLRVFSHSDVEALDPGLAYAAFDFALLRGMVRELYSFDTRVEGERSLEPVPDLADGPYQLSDDGRTYTFQLRRGVRYAPPVDREVLAKDFVYAIERQLDPDHPLPQPLRAADPRGRRLRRRQGQRDLGHAGRRPHPPDHPRPAGQRLPQPPHPAVLLAGARGVRLQVRAGRGVRPAPDRVGALQAQAVHPRPASSSWSATRTGTRGPTRCAAPGSTRSA